MTRLFRNVLVCRRLCLGFNLLAVFAIAVKAACAAPLAGCGGGAVVSRQVLVAAPFAVPVAVPVAPFAPYWYGLADFGPVAAYPARSTPRPPRATPSVSEDSAPPNSADPPRGGWLARKCGQCHGEESPQHDLSLVDPGGLSSATRLAAIREVLSQRMPPPTHSRLSEEEIRAVVLELSEPRDKGQATPQAAAPAPPATDSR